MDPVAKAFTITFLVATMLSIGLKATGPVLLAALEDRRWMVKSLLLNFLILPGLGLLLVAVIPMSTDVAVAVLLLAASPGGLNAIQFTSKTMGGLPYAAALLLILTFLSVLLSPVLAAFMLPMQASVTLPYGKIILFLLLGVLLPLGAGFGVHRASLIWAQRLAKPVALIGSVSFVVVVFLLMAQRKQAMASLQKAELGAMLGFILAAMALGWLLGGPRNEHRAILATGSSMRNVALGLMIAVNSFPEGNVDVAIVAFGALMIPANMLFTVYHVIRGRLKGKAETLQTT